MEERNCWWMFPKAGISAVLLYCHHLEDTLFKWLIVAQSLSCVRLSSTPWTVACQAPLSSTISWRLRKFMSIESVISLLFNTLSRFVIAFLPRSSIWLQSLSAVILDSKKVKSVTASNFSSSVCHGVMGLAAMILVFWILSFKPSFSPSFTLIERLFSSSLLSAIRMISSACLRLLIFLPAVLIPGCDSSSPAFHMVYSSCKLNKQGDNTQPWHIPFAILNQSVVLCVVPAVAFWPSYRFIRKHVRWYYIPISFPPFVVIHTVKGFSVVNEAKGFSVVSEAKGFRVVNEVHVLLEFPCFLHAPTNVGKWLPASI